MESKRFFKEILIVIIGCIFLGASVSFGNNGLFLASVVSFLIIMSSNSLTKKVVGYFLEIGVEIRFWSWYQYGFRKASHFKKPVPMIWLPVVLSFLSKGYFWWLGILEFDVIPKAERVSRRHGLYRFTEVTEWHIAWIALFGIIINLILGFVGYLVGFEYFAKLSIYYSLWSLIPLSSLDGSKIFFSSRKVWAIATVIVGILTLWAMAIV
ncbi:MAG: hypothetical protein WC494_02590 [Candidatus Pacearchaeota archaeon]